MIDDDNIDLFSDLGDLDLVRMLLADLHNDLNGQVSRFRQLADLSQQMGQAGTMMPGEETVHQAWIEARGSFVSGNYIATIMLCQGRAENILAAQLKITGIFDSLPNRISFKETLERCVASHILNNEEAGDLHKLMNLRNPLSHFRDINDFTNLTRRAMESGASAINHLEKDARFAISLAIRILSLPQFRLDG